MIVELLADDALFGRNRDNRHVVETEPTSVAPLRCADRVAHDLRGVVCRPARARRGTDLERVPKVCFGKLRERCCLQAGRSLAVPGCIKDSLQVGAVELLSL